MEEAERPPAGVVARRKSLRPTAYAIRDAQQQNSKTPGKRQESWGNWTLPQIPESERNVIETLTRGSLLALPLLLEPGFQAAQKADRAGHMIENQQRFIVVENGVVMREAAVVVSRIHLRIPLDRECIPELLWRNRRGFDGPAAQETQHLPALCLKLVDCRVSWMRWRIAEWNSRPSA